MFIEWVPVGALRSLTGLRGSWPAKWRSRRISGRSSLAPGACIAILSAGWSRARGARVDTGPWFVRGPVCVVGGADPVSGTARRQRTSTLAKVSGPIIRRSGCWRGENGSPAPPSGYSQCFGLIEAEDQHQSRRVHDIIERGFPRRRNLTIADIVSNTTAPAKVGFKIQHRRCHRTFGDEVGPGVAGRRRAIADRLTISATRGDDGRKHLHQRVRQAGAPIPERVGVHDPRSSGRSRCRFMG